MKVITEHHKYELANHENKEVQGQTIQFIQKESRDGLTFTTVSDGTTNEEVLEMLIDRMKGLAAKVPSKETACAITKLEEALMWLEKRTRDRVKRGVENTPQR